MTSIKTKTSSWALLARLIAPYKGLAAATLVTLCCDITGMLVVPTELSGLLNAVLAGGDMGQVFLHGGRMLAAALLGSLGCIVSYRLASRLAANVGRDLRCAVYEHSLAFSGADFNRFGAGTMITRTLSDVNVVQQTLLMTFIMLGPAPVTSVIAVIMAFSIDRVMGFALLGVTLVVLVVSAVAVAKSAPIFVVMQSFIDRMNVRLRESITGVRVIRAFGKETHDQARLDETFSDYADRAIRVNLVFSVTDTMTYFCMNAVEALIFWLGADRVGAHAMGVGSISAVLEYAMLIMFFMMMAQFALLQIPRAMACLERAAEVLDLEPSIAWEEDGANGEREDTAEAAANVPVARFDHVSFRYDDADEDTLRDLDFSIRRGQTTAIIGNTGSGKSTVAKLLLRFLDATEGAVEFGGSDVRGVAKSDLLGGTAYVPQKAWLFSGTIADNLRYGDDAATEERLWHAVDVAQGGFVHELEDGLDTRVAQGGTNFSGGQRQRLAIARALVRRADLYIFDDSFSALDFKTDAALRRALKSELSDAAVLIIAQRVSTIRDADQIVVLSDGQVVGLGTHDELRRVCPTYKEICDSQERGGAENGNR
jgi:ATP-binding cassette, subfamily B, multidrug efflux pump